MRRLKRPAFFQSGRERYASGTANTLRPTGMTYPSAVTTTIGYDGETADSLSRPSGLALINTDEVSYRYLGLAQVIGLEYLVPEVEMTYENGSTGSAGDKYSGLDAFGRVVETRWLNSSPTVIQNVTYGYDRASNRLWRRNDRAHTLSNGQETKHDNLYQYDGLYQVVDRQQGNLTTTTSPPNWDGIDNVQQAEDWCYDATGNWQHYDKLTPSLSQTRAHNDANEITSVTNPASVIQPDYDEVGNQTIDIAPGDWTKQYNLTWDAWNRLIEVEDNGTSTVIQTNAYDGLHRRITSNDGTDTTHYYYDKQWRAVEEYLNASSSVHRRYLWGLRSRWDLVKRIASGNPTKKRYVLYDAMDPVAICDESATIKQRFEYSPFGQTTFMTSGFVGDPTPENWNFLFHGEFRDAETGYYNYGYRYYNDTTGRWVSRDPIGERGGINLYGFVGNATLNYRDRHGLQSDERCCCDDVRMDYTKECCVEGKKVKGKSCSVYIYVGHLQTIYKNLPSGNEAADRLGLVICGALTANEELVPEGKGYENEGRRDCNIYPNTNEEGTPVHDGEELPDERSVDNALKEELYVVGNSAPELFEDNKLCCTEIRIVLRGIDDAGEAFLKKWVKENLDWNHGATTVYRTIKYPWWVDCEDRGGRKCK